MRIDHQHQQNGGNDGKEYVANRPFIYICHIKRFTFEYAVSSGLFLLIYFLLFSCLLGSLLGFNELMVQCNSKVVATSHVCLFLSILDFTQPIIKDIIGH